MKCSSSSSNNIFSCKIAYVGHVRRVDPRSALHCRDGGAVQVLGVTVNLNNSVFRFDQHCNCIVTRGGVYDEILPEPKGNPEGEARAISRWLSQYFTVYPNSSHTTVILNYL